MPILSRFVTTPRVPAVAAFLLLALVLVSCIGAGPGLSSASDFQVTLFDGSSFRLSGEAGQRAVVLNFWFPSCPPCRAEMPAFQQAWEEVQGEDVVFLGLFVPQGFDTEQDALDFVDELGLTYDFATDVRVQTLKAAESKLVTPAPAASPPIAQGGHAAVMPPATAPPIAAAA